MRILVVASVLVALPAFSAEPLKVERAKKAAWEWSTEERLAARFDPELAAKRAAGRLKTSRAANVWSEVNGSESPEVFLPIELFTHLMSGIETDGADRANHRAILRDRIIEFGLDEEQFWRELEQVTASYKERIVRNEALAQEALAAPEDRKGEIEIKRARLQTELCSSRADMLEIARKHFTSINFDRFLYSVVAPDLTITSTAPGGETAEHLRYLAGGCK